jgi:hypothetical protein
MSFTSLLTGRRFNFGIRAAICLIASAAIFAPVSTSQGSQDYVGKWVCKYEGKNLIVLTLKFAGGRYTGAMAMPKKFEMGQGGSFTKISSEVGEEKVVSAKITAGHLLFTTKDADDENQFSMARVDRDHATLALVGMPLAPWKLARVGDSDDATVATDWPADAPKTVSPEITALQAKLKQMAEEDQGARKAESISDFEVDKVDAKNYPEIERIFSEYGWPAISVVGKEAAGEFWLLVQHQDDHLEFQQRVLKAMEHAADAGEASKVDYAYLYDRVQTNEGKLQYWGTQTTCKNGKAVMNPVDDPAGLQKRRNELELMPLDKYLESLAPYCKDSNSHGPARKY